MNELIKINENGKTTARELYEFLELDLTHFSKWCKSNILENQFAEECKDYEVLALQGENPLGGRPSQNYSLSIDFAKKLCMVSKSKRGEQARNYFIEVEKRFKKVISNPKQSSELEAKIRIAELIINVKKDRLHHLLHLFSDYFEVDSKKKLTAEFSATKISRIEDKQTTKMVLLNLHSA